MNAARNHLIELLPAADRLRLLGVCEPVPLSLSEVLCNPGEPTRHVYFPTEGFVSLMAIAGDAPALEVGMIGREGMLGTQLVLGVDTAPLRALVQGQGTAWRIEARAFRQELARSSALRHVLDSLIHVLMTQLTRSAACVRYHAIGPRLARWMLMSQDRARSDQFRVTHEFLSAMLGVRRVGITNAAGLLQRAGLIEYRRGEMKVLDRAGLEAAACGCYAEDQRNYVELFDPDVSSPIRKGRGSEDPTASAHRRSAAVPP